jgi:hypothetical protein
MANALVLQFAPTCLSSYTVLLAFGGGNPTKNK